MKRNELWLGCLLAVAGFFGACTNVVEDESQNNKYPMELMAEKSAITFTRSIGEKTEWDGGELVSLYDGFSQKLYEVSQSGEMSAKNNDPLYWYTTTEEETLFAWYPSSENQIIGHYNDKQCTLDTAEKMKEGKYKRFVVDGGYKEVTHHLQVGDYYYADGSVVSGNEAEPAKDNCIGIVCWVGNPMPSVLYKDVAGTPYTATNDALLRSHPNCVHGLVMSLYTETGKFSPALTQSIHDWFMTTSFTSSYVSVTGYYDANENNKNKPLRFLGYNNSEVLDLYYDTFKTDFECFQYQDDCESSFPSPSITTGWYVPSSGELVALQDKDNSLESKLNTKLIKVSDKTMDISATYWSSTERNNKNMYIVTYSKTAGSAGTGGVKTNTYTYRFFLGF